MPLSPQSAKRGSEYRSVLCLLRSVYRRPFAAGNSFCLSTAAISRRPTRRPADDADADAAVGADADADAVDADADGDDDDDAATLGGGDGGGAFANADGDADDDAATLGGGGGGGAFLVLFPAGAPGIAPAFRLLRWGLFCDVPAPAGRCVDGGGRNDCLMFPALNSRCSLAISPP